MVPLPPWAKELAARTAPAGAFRSATARRAALSAEMAAKFPAPPETARRVVAPYGINRNWNGGEIPRERTGETGETPPASKRTIKVSDH